MVRSYGVPILRINTVYAENENEMISIKKVKINPFILADQKQIFANSVGQDEMACKEPSHLDLHCSPFC